jgi:hypothetical protein
VKALMMAKKQSIESEIGGYFGLELNYRGEYHPNAMKLNSGRNALKLVLSKEQLKHLYLPHYICNAVVQAVDGAGVAYEFYAIDQNFEPHLTTQPRPHSTILAVNYFGLQDHTVHRLAER